MDSETLKHLQQVEFEILCSVDDFCQKNNIHYALFCGTLLGAVRHGGFIPWDDDIDIVMTRPEYTNFCAAWDKSPVPGYYFEHFETDDNCTTSHGKVRKNGTVLLTPSENPSHGHHGIWIDIFPLDKLSNDPVLNKKTLQQANKIIALTRANDVIPTDGFAKKAARTLIRIIPKSIRKNELLKAVKWFQKNHENVQSNYVWKSMAASWHIKKWTFPQGMPDEYGEVTFNGRTFPAFKNYKGMLELLYGDYMKLPPESERICKHNPLKIEFS